MAIKITKTIVNDTADRLLGIDDRVITAINTFDWYTKNPADIPEGYKTKKIFNRKYRKLVISEIKLIHSQNFKTKGGALKYAKAYMRTH